MNETLPPLLHHAPGLKPLWTQLIAAPTPVHRLRTFGQSHGIEVWTKREDQTDSRAYGGNKVRNLEFILGAARAAGADRVLTCAPFGSNFVAALSAQAPKLGIQTEVHHFFAPLNAQTNAHARYSQSRSAELHRHPGSLFPSLALTYTHATLRRALLGSRAFTIAEGGSSPLGTLGHLNAYLEFVGQVRRGVAPRPDVIFVGAGTCGTIAGLLAGSLLTEHPIPVVGVRTVPGSICHETKIARLANRTLAEFRLSPLRVRPEQVALIKPRTTYAQADWRERAWQKYFETHEGFALDTTYTSKVIAALHARLADGSLYGQGVRRVLYWHTYSPAAEGHAHATGPLNPKTEPRLQGFFPTPAPAVTR